ncbi:MAG: hypothetical protein ACJA1R_003121 [Flavobacteriales bacterium]|jgi:hypothetical protein
MPLNSADVLFEFVPTKTGGCAVAMTMNYTVNFGVLARLMDVAMLRRAMTESLSNLLAWTSTSARVNRSRRAGSA